MHTPAAGFKPLAAGIGAGSALALEPAEKDPLESWPDPRNGPQAERRNMMLAIAILLTVLLVAADVKELKALPRRQRRLGS